MSPLIFRSGRDLRAVYLEAPVQLRAEDEVVTQS